ncbi:hypothetical protein K491DRAFT_723865 [Lophiostoma macrostomum CBS 122681]|uniref:Reverse transcriptase RNase H-like domain-containing protein n=1 Tax=Lophiostoma macrostomum CBS 122681 TaxID=1314788 RepID=A0A6A6SLD8_9PLEO|nr:hypothetical protein K491DRAFT_723865 [Lophiostoma macrostomum CBS 122681]
MRWAITVANFNLKLTYQPGTTNIVANALSQLQPQKLEIAALDTFIASPSLDNPNTLIDQVL